MNSLTHENLVRWKWIGIAAGLVACFAYPAMIFIPLPRVPQVIIAVSFGPAIAISSVALAHILAERKITPTTELAAVCNALAGALVTAMIVVQLAINYSTAPAVEEALGGTIRRSVWDVVLGLDVAFDVFIGLATVLFAFNMIGDRHFGRVIGWMSVSIGLSFPLVLNLYCFPNPPTEYGFPEVGMVVGLWYLAVVVLLIRAVRKRLNPNA